MTNYGMRSLAAVLLGLLLSPAALGQTRMQFPTLLGDGTVPPPNTTGAGPGPSTVVQSPGVNGAPSVYGAPPGNTAPVQPAPNYAPPPNYATPPAYTAPGAFGQPGAPVNPLAPSLGPQTAPVGPVPGAQFGGNIQPPPPTWDPYAPPGSAPPALLPQDPYLPYNTPTFSTGNIQRFLQEARLDYVWMAGHGEKEFGVNDAEIYGTFAFPFFHNTQTPLLVTPGFAVHFWEGPVTTPGNPADLPPVAYDAFLEGAWNPQVTATFGGELSFRVGVYSDFNHVNEDSIRYQGKGMALVALSPNVRAKAGVWYLDRNKFKMLPAGGFVWTPQGPDGNVVLEILFPNPRVAFRLADFQNSEWWLYGRGEYGGGAWTVKRASGDVDQVDYNDIRVAVGLEFIRPRFSGLFEVGGAFEREIVYVVGPPDITRPNPTVFLRGSLAF